MTPEKVELGKQLYFDPRLSCDDTVSCASCHDPEEGLVQRHRTSPPASAARSAAAAPRRSSTRPIASCSSGTAAPPARRPGARARFRTRSRWTTSSTIASPSSTRSPATRAVPQSLRHRRDAGKHRQGHRQPSSGPSSRATRPTTSFKAGDKKALSAAAQRGLKLFFWQGSLLRVPRGPEFHRRRVPQHRRRHESRQARPGPLRSDQSHRRQGRVQNAHAPRSRPPRPLHARRQHQDAGRRHRVTTTKAAPPIRSSTKRFSRSS